MIQSIGNEKSSKKLFNSTRMVDPLLIFFYTFKKIHKWFTTRGSHWQRYSQTQSV